MANIVRKDPFFELTSLRDRMNQLFNQAFGGLETLGFEQPLTAPTFLPPVDISEDDHNITLKAEIPGVKVEDVGITLENNVLTLKGDRRFEKETNQENYHRIERSYGGFSRAFTIPTIVDEDKIRADYKDGILKIALPKKEQVKAKQIKIGD